VNENPLLRMKPFIVPESNVFLMTRFRQTGYHEAISDAVAEGVRAFGLEFVRADDPNIPGTTLWNKIKSCIEACHYGVAIFEDIDEKDFNPNVSLELGYMMALKREYLLLKEQRLEKLPADLCGHLYKEFDSFRIRPTVLGQIAGWLKSIGVRKRDQEKLVVFVSYGGQDRCAIAKAITNHLLQEDKCTLNFRIESRSAFNPSGSTAAKAGIEVVQKQLKKDWLGGHRPRRAGAAFLFEADLILATDGDVLSKLSQSFENYPGTPKDQYLVRDEIQEKLHLLSEFFGGTGEIKDPFPDRGDEKSKLEYEKCFEALHNLLSGGLSALTKFLERDDPPKAKLRTVSFGDRLLLGTCRLGSRSPRK
jgi:protein-tyrosine-phosphatase